MELFSFTIMIVLTNVYFLVREMAMIIDLQDKEKDALLMTEYVLSIMGIIGSTIFTVFILLILKPVFDGMYEDVFLKIGGNGNMWQVYKYFTLCKSFLKLDVVISSEFFITAYFYWFNMRKPSTDADN